MIEFFYFLLFFGDLLFMRRWYSSCAWLDKLGGALANRASSLHSACTSFYALVAGHGVDGDEGLVQSLVETGDGLSQVFALLDYHLRLALCQSHRRGD